MQGMMTIFRREFGSYFATPVALVFSLVFLVLAGAFTFYMGDFFLRDQADLNSFFMYHPWLYLFLIPALSMRLWAEDRRSGTFELLLTLPIGTGALVLGKFFAAWVFAGLVLALTFPIWITVNYLGTPDNGVIFAGYVGSFLMAGAYLSIGTAFSAMTRNQVIAFVGTALTCFLFMASAFPIVQGFLGIWAPTEIINLVVSFSFLTHFTTATKGLIEGRDIIFFLSLSGFWLFVNYLVVQLKREAG